MLAAYAVDLRFDDLPEPVVNQAIQIIRDTFGAMLAGSTLPEVRYLAQLAPSFGGIGSATLIGHGQTSTPHFAALVNGTAGVSLELDEGNQYAVNHPAVHLLPAVWALAETQEVSGKELLTAFIAGYEISVRVGQATHLRDPVHPFGTHAVIGTAAAAARLMKLSPEHTSRALDLAAGLTLASSQTAANSGASVRNLFTGFTNHNGLLAPALVVAGFTGEPDALKIVYGRILGDSFAEGDLGHDLGKTYYITRNYFKLHACSRWNHAPIEAAAALLEKFPVAVDDVAAITVWTYSPATRLSGQVVHNGYAAKHSIPYNVAARIVYHTNDLTVYSDEAVHDSRVQALMQKIQVVEDPALTAVLPDLRPARVEIRLESGQVLTETVTQPRGGFDNPFSEAELLTKFRTLAGMALSPDAIHQIENLLPTLPHLRDLSPLSVLLRRKSTIKERK